MFYVVLWWLLLLTIDYYQIKQDNIVIKQISIYSFYFLGKLFYWCCVAVSVGGIVLTWPCSSDNEHIDKSWDQNFKRVLK